MNVTIAALGFVYFQEYLPSGNANVRLHQYELALDSFVDSPIWGKAYTGSSGEFFVENSRAYNLPTHSDLIDLLKQGGLIAFSLWALGMFKSIRLFLREGLRSPTAKPFFHAMAFMSMATIFSMAVNPLLLKPPFAFVIWGVLALAISIASDDRKGQFGLQVHQGGPTEDS